MRGSLRNALAGIVGGGHCLDGADRSPYVVEGRVPSVVVFPGTVDEASRVVTAAAGAGVPVIPWGGGTRMSCGAPPRDGAVVVSTRRLGRVLEHEPGDLTATAEAGITIAALQAVLGSKGQWMSVDPPLPAQATLGGVLAVNAAGPRRYLYGTMRDSVIGVRVVGADGAVVRAGGKVVKNVAGYDLTKLYIGSLGTLGIVVDVTVKLRPRPEADRACWATFGEISDAAVAVRHLMASDLIPHSLELLDAGAVTLAGRTLGVPAAGGAALLVGFDGLPTTVAQQVADARRLLADSGARSVSALEEAPAEQALSFVRDIEAAVSEPVARATAGVLPTQVGHYLAEAAHVALEAGLGLVSAAHAGSGIVTTLLTRGDSQPQGGPESVTALARLRAEARARGGHLLVEWAPLAVKEEVSVWDPPGPATRLMQAIKAQLDPKGIMNPGRFAAGI